MHLLKDNHKSAKTQQETMLGTEPGHLSGILGTHIDIEGGEHTRTHMQIHGWNLKR